MESEKENKDLSIIIVSWNVQEKLKENLKAIFNSEETHSNASVQDLDFEVFIVDNNSSDGTVEMIKNDFPQVKLISNNENFGFAKANNQVIRQAKGDSVLLLNPDMKVFPDTLVNMAGWMKENKQAWVAGCNLVDEKGENIKHVRRFPTIWDQLAIIFKLPHLFPSVLKKYIREDFDYNKQAKVDSIRGGFFMIRNDIFKKIGLLDERYFIWFEEVDFCREVYKNNGEVWYTPSAKCIDFIGQSFKQLPAGKKQLYFRNSQLAYFKKWHPIWQFLILKIAWVPGMLLANIGEKLNIKSISKT